MDEQEQKLEHMSWVKTNEKERNPKGKEQREKEGRKQERETNMGHKCSE